MAGTAFLGPFKDFNQFCNHSNIESIELVLTCQLDSGTTTVNRKLDQRSFWWILHCLHQKTSIAFLNFQLEFTF